MSIEVSTCLVELSDGKSVVADREGSVILNLWQQKNWFWHEYFLLKIWDVILSQCHSWLMNKAALYCSRRHHVFYMILVCRWWLEHVKEKKDYTFFKVLDIFEVLEKRVKYNHLKWHKRMDQASAKVIRKLHGVDSGIIGVSACDICFLEAKQCRSEFSLSTNKSKEYFEMINCDLWRPYQTPSLNSFSYFITIVNDYSRAVSVFFFVEKTRIKSLIVDFFLL